MRRRWESRMVTAILENHLAGSYSVVKGELTTGPGSSVPHIDL